MTAKVEYNFWTGLKKSLKNTLIVFAPILLNMLIEIANLPSVNPILAGIAGLGAYMLKNYIELNKK